MAHVKLVRWVRSLTARIPDQAHRWRNPINRDSDARALRDGSRIRIRLEI